jgi:hypothetical protein
VLQVGGGYILRLWSWFASLSSRSSRDEHGVLLHRFSWITPLGVGSKWGLDLGLWREARFLLLAVLGDGEECH